MISVRKIIFWYMEGFVLAVVIIGTITFGLWFLANKIDTNIASSKYNNGICESCGGDYIYLQAVGHYIDTDYIYECNKCGKHIEIPKYMSKQ